MKSVRQQDSLRQNANKKCHSTLTVSLTSAQRNSIKRLLIEIQIESFDWIGHEFVCARKANIFPRSFPPQFAAKLGSSVYIVPPNTCVHL